MARGNDAVGRATGVSEGFGEACFFGVGVSSGSGVGFFFAFDFTPFFDFGVGSFLAAVFFFADFGFALGLGDSFGVGELFSTCGVSLGFGFGEVLFFAFASGDSPPFALGLGDWLGLGEAVGSGVSVGFAFGFGEAAFAFAVFDFAFGFGVGVGLGDLDGEGEACGFTGSARLTSSVCARRAAPTIALSANAVARKIRKRTTAAERNRAGHAFNSRKISAREKFSDSPNQAGCAIGAAGGGVILSSSSRRTIAFNFPPSSTSRQVRYIHVSRTISDASAR